MELSESRKVIKKKIRKDISDHEEKVICEILEESGSTKKLWKELSRGQNMLVNLICEIPVLERRVRFN